MSAPRIVLADHRRLFRTATAEALETAGIDVVARVDDVSSALLQVQRVRPDAVVAAAAFPATAELLPALRRLEPRPRALVVDDERPTDAGGRLLGAIESGADGYVTGRSGIAGLAEAIQRLVAGESVVPPDMLGPLLRGLIDRRRQAAATFERLIDLTPREREVLALLGDGLDQEAIARSLVISPETARTHIQRVLRKLGVHSRLEAVTLVAEHGLAERLERVIERTGS